MKPKYSSFTNRLVKSSDHDLMLLWVIIALELTEISDNLAVMMILSELRYRGLLTK